MVKDCGLLVGREQILAYLGIAQPAFYEFVKLGMPAVSINSRWYAHQKNLDDYFITLTRKTMKEIPENSD
jgi:hypothetical protein